MVSDVLCVTVVQGQSDWDVSCSPTQICALEGSTVDINCTYRSSPRANNQDVTVERTFWYTNLSDHDPVDLRTDPEYAGRVQYHCDKNDCTLRITDLRESDSAQYRFKFKTSWVEWTSVLPGTTLTVAGTDQHKQI